MGALLRGRPGIDAYEEGAPVGLGVPAINFVGSNVTVTYDAANDRFIVTITGVANHGDLVGVTADQHHDQDHDHTSTDGSGALTAAEHDGADRWFNVTAPTTVPAGEVQTFAANGLFKEIVNLGVGGFSAVFAPGELMGLITGPGQVGMMMPPVSGLDADMFTGVLKGMAATLSATGTSAHGAVNAGKYIQLSTGIPPAAGYAGYEHGNVLYRSATAGVTLVLLARMQFDQVATAGQRFFFGWTDQALANVLSTDTPVNGNYFGLHYAPNLSANIRFVKGAGGALLFTDLSFPPVAGTVYYLRLFWIAGVMVTQVLDANLAVLVAAASVSGGPGAATLVRTMLGVGAAVGVTASARWYQSIFVNRQ